MIVDEVKAICSELNIVPHKSKGQSFLINDEVIDQIIDQAGVLSDDLVLEVGPGLGVLTEGLLKVAGEVVAVELDDKLVNYLQNKFVNNKKLRIIHQDVLNTDVNDIIPKNREYRVIANLPYNITSRFLRIFMALDRAPVDMVLMLQKEVAERIVTPPGKMSKLSVMMQFYGRPEILFMVDKTSFWPEPAVNSAIIRIELKKDLPDINIKRFFELVNIGFSARRKQLKNNLAGGLKISNDEAEAMLKKLNLNVKARAQDLTIEDWVKLAT
jgi:16S rRNA (adenine1518-N6/adenine1519-N6)-dimethyltransferase